MSCRERRSVKRKFDLPGLALPAHCTSGLERVCEWLTNVAIHCGQVHVSASTVELDADLHKLSPHTAGFGIGHHCHCKQQLLHGDLGRAVRIQVVLQKLDMHDELVQFRKRDSRFVEKISCRLDRSVGLAIAFIAEVGCMNLRMPVRCSAGGPSQGCDLHSGFHRLGTCALVDDQCGV